MGKIVVNNKNIKSMVVENKPSTKMTADGKPVSLTNVKWLSNYRPNWSYFLENSIYHGQYIILSLNNEVGNVSQLPAGNYYVKNIFLKTCVYDNNGNPQPDLIQKIDLNGNKLYLKVKTDDGDVLWDIRDTETAFQLPPINTLKLNDTINNDKTISHHQWENVILGYELIQNEFRSFNLDVPDENYSIKSIGVELI